MKTKVNIEVEIEANTERLSQGKMLAHLGRDMQLNDMLTLYVSEDQGKSNHSIYCALIPFSQRENALSTNSWDLSHGSGMPSAVIRHDLDGNRVEYLRYGDLYGVEPLIIDRQFSGTRSNYLEICEEFRHFHLLYHDVKQDQYVKIGDDGHERLIAVVQQKHVEIRLQEIRQFLAIKEMCLSIQFDCREFSSLPLEMLGIKEGGNEKQSGNMCWGLHFGDLGDDSSHRAFSRLLGKRLIDPLPKVKSGFWGFAEERVEKHIEFIIGVSENGDEILHTSSSRELGNFFGSNPDAPNYLTAVHFRKQVLDKYYQQPSRYSVEDSLLRCGNLWAMQLDNHHEEKVCVWLGDLGRDLPYEEKLHWRSHNISPQGGVSETYFKRQILAQPTDSWRPEILFKQNYHALQKTCAHYLGWQIIVPLGTKDEHHFQALRIPATSEQRDFDELVLSLTKLLIDSLNEGRLKEVIGSEKREGVKGSIDLLDATLVKWGSLEAASHISFLRKLQDLRSSGTAHRKGTRYQKVAAEFDIQDRDLRDVFASILRRSIQFLEYLNLVVCANDLRGVKDRG
jgi:hypothetical protein